MQDQCFEKNAMKNTLHTLLTISAILLGPSSAVAQDSIATQPIQEHEQATLFPSAHMIEVGRNVAKTACAECHGLDGTLTDKDQPAVAGQRAIYLYRVLKAYQSGAREDEAMQKVSSFLNDEALLSVSAYYAGQTPARNPAASDTAKSPEWIGENPFTGIQPALGKCVKCHGETGNSTASGMPNLTGQAPEYFQNAVQAYAEGKRSHKLMSKLVSQLDPQTIKDMGIYYAVQQPAGTETVGDGNAEAGAGLVEKCATCHGGDGNASSANTPSLAGQDARYFVKAMQAYQEGKRNHEKMAEAVAGLNETQMQDMAAFYASQKPVARGDIRAPFTTAEWVERCERCHGLNGNSTDPRFPMLAGQNENYLRKALQAYSGGSRPTSVMHAMAEPLSQADIERIVRHYSAQDAKSVVYIPLPCENAVQE
jgi:cytochrome c553